MRRLTPFAATVLLLSACQTAPPVPAPQPQTPVAAIIAPAPLIVPPADSTCARAKKIQEQEGIASWYGRSKRPRKTASGALLDPNAATAAHRTLPFGSRVRVTNLANGRETIVTINDRGPFVRGRVIDVSQKTARDLGFLTAGLARVRIEPAGGTAETC